ncbi:dipeptide/oligopeptide/nickel ABC transporter ATP-binding protein [Actinomadura sp. NBRC 104425]|uniref:ABC transporter ATP-binding protein n=1 Tax=Actinomadura sp. NBRC 104425 TaxID=3032204 RepID=UPI0024A1666E|nr:ABC transporter ATP-binding protein [Actinomadura sp. NBRC 104425]GLZ15987.1 dipeptide/oligopeptide/nickel ABC transporter ATP-binding protein [Actinomadura sp. NBRC 104425]
MAKGKDKADKAGEVEIVTGAVRKVDGTKGGKSAGEKAGEGIGLVKTAADTAGSPSTAFLEVRDLRIHFPTDDGLVKSVDGLSFRLERGKTLGIVGESGSGKSVTSLGILGLHNRRNARVSGEIWLNGKELVGAPPDEVRRLRGRTMAMIFQDPLSAMHPFYTVGQQIIEAYRLHNDVSKQVARKHAIDMLGRVGIPRPDRRVDDYPHQFSGGMRQRAMIAMALSCNPELLIADEPTTALDVTVQAQILDLIRDLQEEFNSAVIMITHDLGVVAELSDDILVMYAGRCVEYASVDDAFHRPLHPYTWGLLGSMPRLDRARAERLMPIKGTPPSLINVPQGCAFNPRCAYAGLTDGKSETERPELREVEPGHKVACHLPLSRRREIWNTEIAPKL